jgi:phosphate transport system substrate-binding protein
MRRVWMVGLLVISLLTAACGSKQQSINIAGSTTVQPLAERLAQVYTQEHPDVKIDVAGGGSSAGVKAAGEGTADIGNTSREVKDSELETYPDLEIFVIARDGIAIITHPDVPVEGLTRNQVREIYAGNITNWSEVGGEDVPITVVSREEGSGTRGAFEEMVMGDDGPAITGDAIFQDSNGKVRTAVSSTPNSIGFLSFGYLDNSVQALQIDGVEPTETNAATGTYPVVRPLNMITNGEPKGVVKAFVDFVLSAEGQKIVTEEGYIAVK